MTNADLIKILQRFPPEGPVKVRQHGANRTNAAALFDVDRAEMAIDATPVRLTEQNISWPDLVKERIQTVLVYGEPRELPAEPRKEPA
jgi:hypothetical protein